MKSPVNSVPPVSRVSAASAPVRFSYSGLPASNLLPSFSTGVLERIGPSTYYLAFYVSLLASLVYQILLSYAGISGPIFAACFVVLFLIYLVSGRPLRFTQSPLVYPWVGLLVWWLLAAGFGAYPRRSFTTIAEYAIRIHVLPLIFCALLVNLASVRTVLYGAGIGLPLLLIFAAKFGTIVETRFIIPNTSFANANDLGLHLLLFGSLSLALFSSKRLRYLAGIVLPLDLYYILKTGSRAAVVTLMAMLLVALVILPLKKKVVLVVVVLMGAALAPLTLPKTTLNRLLTFFSVSQANAGDDELLQQAADSANARMELQRRAVQLTVAHPLLGVGALNFEDSVEQMVREKEKRKSGWQVSHNAYLQVSSESGVPGLLFYAWSVLLCLRLNYQAFRECLKEPAYRGWALQSFALWLGSISFTVSVFFCSIAYDYYLALIVAFTSANHLALKRLKLTPRAQPLTESVTQEQRRPVPLRQGRLQS